MTPNPAARLDRRVSLLCPSPPTLNESILKPRATAASTTFKYPHTIRDQQPSKIIKATMTVPTNPALHPFSFDQWYPLFRRHTFRSVIVDLPADFVDYLSADGIALPEDEVLYSYHDDVDTDALADT
ncbi:hypothetical protein AMAG_18574 [Allomyces macrogynus ATCC 38327]|uniref:Uncharacterized protein n=1 Tax=Allomyces macrogynus (strain ATCC 38327) TaxID=578462 RepID=A0A0L0SDS9_ALLM3|nr:hypothetical protein AMAG_18574 [Allomyces macrogynus ATCC 38327]|eukprot:KNE60641.1 hypothetical protein AMAG_18574 [Allomyces macrogynus ATCC 38327]